MAKLKSVNRPTISRWHIDQMKALLIKARENQPLEERAKSFHMQACFDGVLVRLSLQPGQRWEDPDILLDYAPFHPEYERWNRLKEQARRQACMKKRRQCTHR